MGMIELSNIHFSYTEHGQSFTALENIDFTVNDGEFICVIGRSGCGKTTLLRLLAGLQMPDRGKILIDGKPVTGPGLDRAIVFQNYTLFPWMTALKNVRFGICQAKKGIDRTDAQAMALKYLEMVGMKDCAEKYPARMSGGMQQRVAIARALAMDTDILLLDEPFGALDARNRKELQELLTKLWSSGGKKKTVIFVTHDINEAAVLSDRVIFMKPGRIAADIQNALPRPRDIKSESFKDLRRQLFDLFYEEGEGEFEHETGM